MLAYPGQLRPTLLADAYFTQLNDIERPLAHNAEVKLFCGTGEAIANARLLDADALGQGDSGWLQLRLREAMPLSRGDRFILRYPSPAETIGGGIIINPHPGRRLRRFQPDIISELELRLSGTPAERLALAAQGAAPQKLSDLRKALGYGDDELAAALGDALNEGLVRELGGRQIWAAESWQRLYHCITTELSIYHQANPLRLGMPRPALQSRLKVKLNLLDWVIEGEERLARESNIVRLREHTIRFSDAQERNVRRLLAALAADPYSPPGIAELNEIAGEAVVRALSDLRQIVLVSESIAFAAENYDQLLDGNPAPHQRIRLDRREDASRQIRQLAQIRHRRAGTLRFPRHYAAGR